MSVSKVTQPRKSGSARFDLGAIPSLNPTRSADGKRSSVLIEVEGHVFQAVFVCLPTGDLAVPTIHGTRADRMSPGQRIELEGKARVEAMQVKETHEAELLAGMSVVTIDDLLQCVARAPTPTVAGETHRLADWDVVTGADEFPDPPRSHPTLSAFDGSGSLFWLFWGTLDLPTHSDDTNPTFDSRELERRLAAKQVHIRGSWLGRPEILALF
jgi:hypothetical protein